MTEGMDLPSMQGIGEVIRLAVAPVFLISGVGTMLALFSNRLARAIDRSMEFQRLSAAATNEPQRLNDLRVRLDALARRARLLSSAITLATICGLLVSVVVVLLFVGEALHVRVGFVIGIVFIGAMVSFIAAILCFLREVYVATQTIRSGLYRHH
jgi:Protein of unknown function (DUF2721)